MSGEKVRLRIGSLARAVLITGQAYQEPKDALNEFVSNAADEYAEAGRTGERIRIVLRRKGRYPTVAIDDDGRGMNPERLREVARNLFKSVKVDDDRTLGEKAIGLLAFQQLGARCDIVSRAEGSAETWMLRLERGAATAELKPEKRRARTTPGTTVYLAELDREVLRTITQRKVVDYLRKRRGAALERGDYVIEVQEGRKVELVTPEPIDGVPVSLPPQRTLWGTIEFHLYVAPANGASRTVEVAGKAGTTILDSICDLEEFDAEPWNSGQVTGRVTYPALQQTAGRRAVLREDDAFPLFAQAVRAVEPAMRRAIERLNAEVDRDTADRMSQTVRQIFGAVLKELDDLDNPMRTYLGDEPGAGGLLAPDPTPREPAGEPPGGPPSLAELTPGVPEPPAAGPEPGSTPNRERSTRLPSIEPDPAPGEGRSRFDPDTRIVYYNERHLDYLLVKDDEPALLDYLASLVAKEYVVYNHPRAAPDDLAEELVRVLVRVRRHLNRRRRRSG